MDSAAVGDIIEQLRADRRAVRGDGFGAAGNLIGAYKRTLQALEMLQVALDGYKPEEVDIEWRPNPDCFGIGGDSVSACECLRIFESLSAGSQSVRRTPD